MEPEAEKLETDSCMSINDPAQATVALENATANTSDVVVEDHRRELVATGSISTEALCFNYWFRSIGFFNGS
jgi:hypothetical protein